MHPMATVIVQCVIEDENDIADLQVFNLFTPNLPYLAKTSTFLCSNASVNIGAHFECATSGCWNAIEKV